MEQGKKSSPGMILSRVRLIGEGVISKEELSNPPNAIWIFLQEEDPEKWPPEMSHLKKYLQEEVISVISYDKLI